MEIQNQNDLLIKEQKDHYESIINSEQEIQMKMRDECVELREKFA